MKKLIVLLTVLGIAVTSKAARSFSATNLPIRVKFTATRIAPVKDNGVDYVKGRVGVSIRSDAKFFTRPLLRVVMFTEENGVRVIRDAIMDEPGVKVVRDTESNGHYSYERWVRKTTTMTATDSENSGKNKPNRYCRTIQDLSASESEVSKTAYANASYEGVPLGEVYRKGIKSSGYIPVWGFCKFSEDEKAKLLGYRLEIWHEGKCAAYWESFSLAELKRYDLPNDWHVTTVEPPDDEKADNSSIYIYGQSKYVFKYAKKFKYRSPWASKQVDNGDKSDSRRLFRSYYYY